MHLNTVIFQKKTWWRSISSNLPFMSYFCLGGLYLHLYQHEVKICVAEFIYKVCAIFLKSWAVKQTSREGN